MGWLVIPAVFMGHVVVTGGVVVMGGVALVCCVVLVVGMRVLQQAATSGLGGVRWVGLGWLGGLGRGGGVVLKGAIALAGGMGVARGGAGCYQAQQEESGHRSED